MEDDNPNSSIIALKIIMALSLILVGMDMLEVFFSYVSLKEFAREFDHEIFEQCIKYHMLTQIIFTIFATMAGLSAFLMSAGLLISHNFFATKAIESFVNFNYNIFGPYLFTMSLFGIAFYEKILYNCSRENLRNKQLNFSTLLALLICFLISFFITFVYAFIEGYTVMLSSFRFKRSGFKFLGKLFWRYVFHRRRDEFQRSTNIIDHQFNRLYNEELQNSERNLIENRNRRNSMNINRMNENNLDNEIEMINVNSNQHNLLIHDGNNFLDNNLMEPHNNNKFISKNDVGS